MTHRDSFLPIGYRGRAYQSPKYVSNETLHAHFTSIDETWRIVTPYLQRAGITRLSNVTGLDRIGIPVFNAIRPNLEGYSVAHGKGVTAEAAKLSACMESLERYYGTEKNFPVFTMTYNELCAQYAAVIPYEKLLLTAQSFFHPDWPVKWTLGWDIVHQAEVPVPLELASLKGLSPPARLLLFQISSNGLAAGTDFLEAVCQGLYEVLERDAVTCSTLMARAAAVKVNFLKAVRLDTIPFPEVTTLIERIEAAGILLILYDNTVDTAVPTYNCHLLDKVEPYFGVTHGMGSSLDPATAMIRAITEAVQARAIFHSGVRDIFFHDQYTFFKAQNAEKTIQYLMNEEREMVDASALCAETTPTFEGDIHVCLAKLQQVGIDQVIVFECTAPGADLSVVKIVVPGLEGYMHPYYRPGPRGQAIQQGGAQYQGASSGAVHSY